MARMITESSQDPDFATAFRQAESDWEYLLECALLELTEDIAKEMERQHLSKADLAKRLGVSRAYVSQFFRGKNNVQIRTLFKISHALGMRPLVQMQRPQEEKVWKSTEILITAMNMRGWPKAQKSTWQATEEDITFTDWLMLTPQSKRWSLSFFGKTHTTVEPSREVKHGVKVEA